MPRAIQQPQSDHQPQRWVVVLSTDNLMEAHVVAGRLKSEDIEAWVHQEPGASAFGITVGILGEVRVLVNERDYEFARRLLDTLPDELEADTSQTSYILPDEDPDSNDGE